MSRRTVGALAAVAVASAALLLAPAATATTPITPTTPAAPNATAAPACDGSGPITHALLAQCITLAGVREHQAALQAIAERNRGTRVSGSAGYDASVDYVVQRLTAAGYTPQVQTFSFTTFITLAPAVLQRVAPAPAAAVPTAIVSYSGSGDVTAPVTVVAGAGADMTPGCDPTDFSGFAAGSIALVSRGGCTFALKAQNAHTAGAAAVVIANNVAGPLDATLGDAFSLDIPVVSVTQAAGAQLAAAPGLALRVSTLTFRGAAKSANVIAETSSGNDSNVVMAGAHLDSVNAGPGINDNGSGAAALLEVAEQLATAHPVNRVRFAWWGGEESSLVGSTRYVTGLGQDELSRIALYLNVDMIGSPNPVYFVYDGDGSDGSGADAGPPGSARIEKTFEAFYAQRNLPFTGTDLTGRSDYGPFAAAGIPVGGIFTGAEGLKTPQEAATWGGTAGQPYDPCYHRACDTTANVGLGALDVNSDALGYAVLQFAMNTVDVNGVPGSGDFPPADPTGLGNPTATPLGGTRG